MRWENLSAERDRAAQIPGLEVDPVVRTFDAPEAIGIRFHEIHARSAINRVPGRSPMPFRWTVNPYRGCSHACSYCQGGETPILMADGRTKPLADLETGDAIYGTVRQGNYRRYVITEVLDHWSTVKPACRVTLEDGTELIASGDHRFLSDRGWKHVIGTEWGGPLQRPHLTTNNKLMGIGGFAVAPEHSPDYRQGYLCGMIRGDGHLASYEYERAGRSHGNLHQFRLALADGEALERTSLYLRDLGIATHEFLFHAATKTQRQIRAIRTSARDKVAAIKELIRWPRSPSAEWRQGFLAGIFDAEGCHSQGVLRISNTDREIVQRTASYIGSLGIDCVIEDPGLPNGLRNVRVRGGLRNRMRFLHAIDPAITRKRSIEGMAIKTNARLNVVAIEPLGKELELFDITTGTGDFIADGVVSHNCYARSTHTYLGMNAGRDFEREIIVKVNAPELVRAELARPSWRGEHVALGTNTDPYQWVESRYKLMEGIWSALRDASNPCSLVTRSPLVLRDIEILAEIARRASILVFLSVPTLEEKAWRSTEPHTPHPRKRLEAVARLNEAGVPAGVLIAPLMPGINDDPAQVDEIVRLARQAGAVSIGGNALHLRPEVKEIMFGWLRQHRPDLLPRYEELYKRGAYMPAEERRRIQSLIARHRPRRRPRARPKPPPTRTNGEPPQDNLF